MSSNKTSTEASIDTMMTVAKERLGEKIQQARKAQGYTQQDLANKLEVSLQTVQGWEQGRYTPSARAAKSALKRVLEIDVDELRRSGDF